MTAVWVLIGLAVCFLIIGAAEGSKGFVWAAVLCGSLASWLIVILLIAGVVS